LFSAARLILLKDARHHDDVHTTNEATTCPTISRGGQLHEESEWKPGREAPSGNKNAETHGHYRRKIEPVSFKDLNFSFAGGKQLRERYQELLKHQKIPPYSLDTACCVTAMTMTPETAFAISSLPPLPWSIRSFPA